MVCAPSVELCAALMYLGCAAIVTLVGAVVRRIAAVVCPCVMPTVATEVAPVIGAD